MRRQEVWNAENERAIFSIIRCLLRSGVEYKYADLKENLTR